LWLAPNNAYLIYSRGIAHHENLDYDKALEDYRSLINRALANPKDNQHLNAAYIGRARIMLARGLLDAATKDIHAALDNNPNDALSHLIYAQIQADAENFEGALHSINQAMRLATEPNYFIYTTKSAILTKAGHKAEALATLDELKNLLPQDLIAVTYHMSTLMHFEDYEAALALANQEIAQSPDALVREYMRFNRGEVYRFLGDFDKAHVDFTAIHQFKAFPKAIEKQLPTYAWLGMANLSFAKADYAKAEADFQKAVQGWSEYTVALLGIAAAQYAQGNESAAKASIEAFQAKPSRYKNFNLLEKDKLFQPEIIEIIKKLAQ
jgi:tetratricopeptide (TPR) repeat protein